MNQKEDPGPGPEQTNRQGSERPVFFPPHKISSQLLLGALKKGAGRGGGRERAGLRQTQEPGSDKGSASSFHRRLFTSATKHR